MTSIKDIANKCHVSVATVSKAINDQSDISEATKQKIRKTALKMGYTLNVSARALRTNRTNNLGIIISDDNTGLGHEYFSTILDIIQKEAEINGYDITFINRSVASIKVSYIIDM